MKKDIHPKKYREVVFKDIASDFMMKVGSTVETKETIIYTDGKEYPMVHLEISSGSHPYFTGKEMIMDRAGRVEKFEARRKAAMEKQEKLKNTGKKDLKQIFAAKKEENAATEQSLKDQLEESSN